MKTLSKIVEIWISSGKWPFFFVLIKYNDDNIQISTFNNGPMINIQTEKVSKETEKNQIKTASKNRREGGLFEKISNALIEAFRSG